MNEVIYYSEVLDKIILIGYEQGFFTARDGKTTRVMRTVEDVYEYGTKNQLEYLGLLRETV